MTYNSKDGIWYLTAAEFAADTKLVKEPTNKVYVYETGVIHVTDGTAWHTLGEADA
jgi:hypothetical protein